MNLITISREFGSGGRELGKRLADLLGYDYYDSEIIAAIAEKSGFDKGYIEKVLDQHGWQNYPLTLNASFIAPNYTDPTQVNLLMNQKAVMEEIAAKGNNCIIIGRNADVLLSQYNPLRIFVCAEMDAKVKRCFERASESENLSEKEMRRKIKQVDKARAQTRAIFSGSSWGDPEGYQLTINTTGWDLKALAVALAAFVNVYFENNA